MTRVYEDLNLGIYLWDFFYGILGLFWDFFQIFLHRIFGLFRDFGTFLGIFGNNKIAVFDHRHHHHDHHHGMLLVG